MPTIMIIDDEKNIVELIGYNLKKENFKVISAGDGASGLALAKETLPDLIILDIMLPDKDGFDVCRELRSNPKTAPVPIVMLSARDEMLDKVLGLEIGADDYVTKPFSPRELTARIKANLRHRKYMKKNTLFNDTKEINRNNMVIRPEKYEVEINGNKVNLSPKEFDVLVVLATNPGRVFSRELLLEKIWGFNEKRESRTVDVHIRNLRQKIERKPSRPEIIETIRGIGYRFNELAIKNHLGNGLSANDFHISPGNH